MAQYVADAADRALAEARRAVEALSGDAAEGVALADALVRAAEEVVTRAGAIVKIEAAGRPVVSPEVHEALTRVTREACTNAVRHGGATTLLLHLDDSDGRLHLTITDDGTGFDPPTVKRGYGLRSMRERMEALGGNLVVRSEEGQGTLVDLAVPYGEGAH